jgi:hypothetical protein
MALEQVAQLVDDDVLETLNRLLGELQIHPDPAGVDGAGTPLRLHALDAPVGDTHAQRSFPSPQQRRNQLSEPDPIIPFENKKAIEDLTCYLVRAPLSLQKFVYLDGQKAVLYRSPA